MQDKTQWWLENPKPGITLAELAKELNELGKVRHEARLAFCKRLAVAYLMIVGHVPAKGGVKDARRRGGVRSRSETKPFYLWCAENLRSGTGKPYTKGTLQGYLSVGFSTNPEKTLAQYRAASAQPAKVGSALTQALKCENGRSPAGKPIPVRAHSRRLPSNVAAQVDALMRAWEQASPEARAQFIYQVTGQKIPV